MYVYAVARNTLITKLGNNSIYNSIKIIYLGINLIKEAQEVYTGNYKTFVKEIEEDLNKWKDTVCSWTGRLNIAKIAILPKLIYRFNTVPIRILADFIEVRFDRVWLWDFKDLLISFPGLFCIYKKICYRNKGVTKVQSFWTRRK